MPEVAAHEPGTPSWIDLATNDLDAAKDFYCGLFGWSVVEVPSPEGAYCMFTSHGGVVAAGYRMSGEMIENEIPPHWATYVTVADIDQALVVAQDAGGTVVQPAHRVAGAGRTAAVQDPSAAVFALWEPDGHIGAERVNEAGALVWNELQSHDPERAKAFYGAVFGWSAEHNEMATGHYVSFMSGARPVAGMMQIQPDWGPVPPNWSVYLGVGDVPAACIYAADKGGKVELPPTEVAAAGTFALLQDPQGAFFYVIEAP